jgi:transposase-like protein
MDLNIECPRCHGGQFIRTANPRRDERVTCASCASEFHYGELEDRAVQSAREMLALAFPTMPPD